MLYLRRRPNEDFFIFDHQTEVQVLVHSIDLDDESVVLEITGFDKPVHVTPPARLSILQGDGELHVKQIVNIDNAPAQSFVIIGVEAPRSLKVLRSELLRGITRGQRARMVF